MGKKIDWVKRGLAKGYKFDGCTSSPDLDFGHCCNRHDYDYQDLRLSRKVSDNRLFQCMARESLAGKVLAPFYWVAVRLAGDSHYKRKQNESVQKAIVPPVVGGPVGSDRL